MRVTLSSNARRDRLEIQRSYARESPSAAVGFAARLRDALNYIATYPYGAPLMDDIVRAKTLDRYPMSVHYVVAGDLIYVLAIADQRRDPDHYTRPHT